MNAIEKFRQYLVGRKFIVRTGHNSLKYFMEHKGFNERQQHCVSKLQGYDFDIKLVRGKNNVVADALSRNPKFCSLSEISATWKDRILAEYAKTQHACDALDGKIDDERYKVLQDIIYYKE